jgi:hypothetical protein
VPVPAQPTKAPAPAAEPPAEAADSAARPSRTRPAKPRPAGPPAIRGAGAATADKPANVFNSTSGEIRRQNTPVRGIDSHSISVEVSREVQDPAAFVNTPEPVPPSHLVDEATTRLPPIQATHPADPGARSSDRLSAYTTVQKNDFGGDTDKTTGHLGKRRSGRGIGRWPLVVYIILGVVLGIGTVVAYSVFYGLPLSP